MTIKIMVPELGESVIEATVSRWLKKEGDFVNVGDVLVELEIDMSISKWERKVRVYSRRSKCPRVEM